MELSEESKAQSIPLLSVVIVSFNSSKVIGDCLVSIKEHLTCSYEVIVVDNASEDGSVDILKREYPGVRVFALTSNLGFSAGNNYGCSLALGKYVLLLNNDTILKTDLSSGIDILENNKNIGAVGAFMQDVNGRYRKSAGCFPNPSRLIKFTSLYRSDQGFDSGGFADEVECFRVDWFEASFLLTFRSLWLRVGGMDEEYFMYGEDVDFAKKIVNSGYTLVFVPSIKYVHLGGYNSERIGFLVNGFRRFHYKYSSLVMRILVNIILDLGLIFRFLYYSGKYMSGDKTNGPPFKYLSALFIRKNK